MLASEVIDAVATALLRLVVDGPVNQGALFYARLAVAQLSAEDPPGEGTAKRRRDAQEHAAICKLDEYGSEYGHGYGHKEEEDEDEDEEDEDECEIKEAEALGGRFLCRRQLLACLEDGTPARRFLSKQQLLAYLEYGMLHLLGDLPERCRAFLAAVAPCLEDPKPERPGAEPVTVCSARVAELKAEHQEQAGRLLRALDAEGAFRELLLFCAFLDSWLGERNDEDPRIDRQIFHVGVVASGGSSSSSSSGGDGAATARALHLCCPHEHLVALPLLYLLRDELRTDPRLAAYTSVDVLPPDLQLIMAEERRIAAAAAGASREEGFSAAEELAWFPRSFRGPVGKLRLWLDCRVCDEFAKIREEAEARLKAVSASPVGGGEALVVTEAQRRVATFREGTLQPIVADIPRGGDDEDEDATTPMMEWTGAVWQRGLERHFYMTYLRRRTRHQWWRVHRLPDGPHRQLATITYLLAGDPPCLVNICSVTV